MAPVMPVHPTSKPVYSRGVGRSPGGEGERSDAYWVSRREHLPPDVVRGDSMAHLLLPGQTMCRDADALC